MIVIKRLRRLVNRFIGDTTTMSKKPNIDEPLYDDYEIQVRCECGGEFIRVRNARPGKLEIWVCTICGKQKA